MISDQYGGTDAHRIEAKGLISHLDADELFVLAGLIRGLSRRAIAASSERNLDDPERTFRSLMKKLNVQTIADGVRIGLYAGVDRPD
jgi:hypothetical protein